MEDNKIRVTFAFKVPSAISEEVVEIREKLLSEFDEQYSSEYPSYTPHITVYQAEFPDKNETKIFDVLQKIVKASHEVTFVPTEIGSKGRYVAVRFEKNHRLLKFQKTLVDELSPLRENILKKTYTESFESFEQNEQLNIQSWGYPYLFGSYQPHLTFIALKDIEDVSSAIKKTKWDKEFESNQLEVVVSKSSKVKIYQYPLDV